MTRGVTALGLLQQLQVMNMTRGETALGRGATIGDEYDKRGYRDGTDAEESTSDREARGATALGLL